MTINVKVNDTAISAYNNSDTDTTNDIDLSDGLQENEMISLARFQNNYGSDQETIDALEGGTIIDVGNLSATQTLTIDLNENLIDFGSKPILVTDTYKAGTNVVVDTGTDADTETIARIAGENVNVTGAGRKADIQVLGGTVVFPEGFTDPDQIAEALVRLRAAGKGFAVTKYLNDLATTKPDEFKSVLDALVATHEGQKCLAVLMNKNETLMTNVFAVCSPEQAAKIIDSIWDFEYGTGETTVALEKKFLSSYASTHSDADIATTLLNLTNPKEDGKGVNWCKWTAVQWLKDQPSKSGIEDEMVKQYMSGSTAPNALVHYIGSAGIGDELAAKIVAGYTAADIGKLMNNCGKEGQVNLLKAMVKANKPDLFRESLNAYKEKARGTSEGAEKYNRLIEDILAAKKSVKQEDGTWKRGTEINKELKALRDFASKNGISLQTISYQAVQ